MNALETEHSNLEIDSKLNRQPVKTYNCINDETLREMMMMMMMMMIFGYSV